MRSVLVCDFDDTVVTVDTGALILERFANPEWRQIEGLYDEGKIAIEETIAREFSSVRATRESMLSAVDGAAKFRAGFEGLLSEYLEAQEPLVIASYGIDFCIEHVMRKVATERDVRIFAPKSRLTATGMEFQFPARRSNDSANLKDDAVARFKNAGYRVVYVGDGASDLPALQKADFGFTIRGSKLSKACEKNGVTVPEISSFQELIPFLKRGAEERRRWGLERP